MSPVNINTLSSPSNGFKQPTIVAIHTPKNLEATPVSGKKLPITLSISADAFARQ